MQNATSFTAESSANDWHSAFCRNIEQQRLKTVQFLAGHSRRLGDLEAQLRGDVENLRAKRHRLLDDAESRGKSLHDAEAKIQQRLREIAEKEQSLSKRASDIREREDALRSKEAQLEERSEKTIKAESKLQEQRESLQKEREQFQSQCEHLSQEQAQEARRLDEITAQLAQQQSELQARWNALEAEQEKLAGERAGLEAQRAETQHELQKIERERQELSLLQNAEHGAADDHIRKLSEELEIAKNELRNANQRASKLEVELNQLEDRQSATVVNYEATLDTQIAAERCEWEKRIQELNDELARAKSAHAPDISAALAEKEAELQLATEARQIIEARLENLQRQLASAGGESADLIADYQIRAEIAEAELANSREEIQKLQEKLIASAPPIASGFNWEAKKRQMMRDLDGEGGDDSSEASGPTSEDFLAAAQSELARREAEIASLKQKLEEKASESSVYHKNLMAVEQDDAVRLAREEVEKLKGELQNTLRQSEVELSVQRAKMARERSELDELRMEIDRRAKDLTPQKIGEPQKPQKRNWFSRMGLDRDAK